MTVELRHTITPEDYNLLRKAVGWSPLEFRQAEKGLLNTYYLVAAYSEDGIIGLARLISDGGYMALIADVMVSTEFQDRGIGRMIMEHMMDFIRENLADGLTVMVNLMSVKGKEGFYKQFGFTERPNEKDGAGMHLWLNPF